MITETGRVVAAAGDQVWVQTIRQSACNSCSARHGCGQKALAQVTGGRANQVLVANTLGARVGDEVTLAISEAALLSASLRVYALPLLLFVLGAVAGHTLSDGAELASVAGGVSGLIAGFWLARGGQDRNNDHYAPRLVRIERGFTENCQ